MIEASLVTVTIGGYRVKVPAVYLTSFPVPAEVGFGFIPDHYTTSTEDGSGRIVVFKNGRSIGFLAGVLLYTTAGAEFDYPTTREIGTAGCEGTHGRKVRKVVAPNNRVEFQRDRYESGLHLAASEVEWLQLVASKLATVAR